jgi:hypothetical protein
MSRPYAYGMWFGNSTEGDPQVDRTKFSDLKVGERFIFDDDRACRPCFNRLYGPFRKISTRRYVDTNGVKQPTESIGYKVIRIGGAS